MPGATYRAHYFSKHYTVFQSINVTFVIDENFHFVWTITFWHLHSWYDIYFWHTVIGLHRYMSTHQTKHLCISKWVSLCSVFDQQGNVVQFETTSFKWNKTVPISLHINIYSTSLITSVFLIIYNVIEQYDFTS